MPLSWCSLRLILNGVFPSSISLADLSLLRHEIIKRYIAARSQKGAEGPISLWGPMAVRIMSIMGESGFDSLYQRSVYLTQASYPWLDVGLLASPAQPRFNSLVSSLDGKTPALAGEANYLLLITFTDILASLIGEDLTNSILRSAWSDFALDDGTEELKND